MTWVDRQACPVCGRADGRERWSGAYDAPPLRSVLVDGYAAVGAADLTAVAGGRYVLLDCRGCGLVWQRFAPAPDFMFALYEQWIDPERARARFHAGWTIDQHRDLGRDAAVHLAGFAQPPSALRVLDFAAGWSQWALMVRAHGAQVAVCELSPARRSHAQALGLPVVDPPAGAPFDLIHADQVFEHLADPKAELIRLAALLAPDGRIRLRVPNGRDIDRRLRAMDWSAAKGSRWSLNLVAPLEHLNCFRPQALRRLVDGCGLRPVRRSLVAAWRRSLDLASPRRLAESLIRPVWNRLPWTTDLLLERA